MSSALFDLLLTLEESGDDIVGRLNYASDMFDRETMERWVVYFAEFLKGICDDKGSRVGDLKIIPAADRSRVLKLSRGSDVEFPQHELLPQLFEQRVKNAPDSVAVISSESVWTYAQLNEKANQLANFLITRGMEVGENVPVIMERGLPMLVSQLSIMKAGG